MAPPRLPYNPNSNDENNYWTPTTSTPQRRDLAGTTRLGFWLNVFGASPPNNNIQRIGTASTVLRRGHPMATEVARELLRGVQPSKKVRRFLVRDSKNQALFALLFPEEEFPEEFADLNLIINCLQECDGLTIHTPYDFPSTNQAL
eukprot:EG_transcript_37787